jgi:hypothetical protein
MGEGGASAIKVAGEIYCDDIVPKPIRDLAARGALVDDGGIAEKHIDLVEMRNGTWSNIAQPHARSLRNAELWRQYGDKTCLPGLCLQWRWQCRLPS